MKLVNLKDNLGSKIRQIVATLLNEEGISPNFNCEFDTWDSSSFEDFGINVWGNPEDGISIALYVLKTGDMLILDSFTYLPQEFAT